MAHQLKPTAPIMYHNKDGKKIDAPDDYKEMTLGLNIRELALIQTLVKRSYLNCNCNLDKNYIGSALLKINDAIVAYDAGKAEK